MGNAMDQVSLSSLKDLAHHAGAAAACSGTVALTLLAAGANGATQHDSRIPPGVSQRKFCD
jgi:hypothetical protein